MRPVLPIVVLALLATGCDERPATLACDRYGASPQELADELRKGQVGCLREGDYEGDLALRRGGITIRAEEGGRARLRGTVSIEAPDVTLAGLEMYGTGGANAVKVYSERARLEGNRITTEGRPYSCVILGGDPGVARDAVVRRNLLIDCGNRQTNKDHAIYASRVRGARIEENLIVRPAAYAVQIYPDAQDVLVRRNRVDAAPSVRGGFVIGGGSDSASSGNRLEENAVNGAQVALRTTWENEIGTRNVARANCLDGDVEEDAVGIEVQDAREDCDLDLGPLLERAGVRL